MAADGINGRSSEDRVANIFGAFAREVFTPMVASLTGVPAAERRRLLDDIRRRLDIVEDVIATEEAAGLPAQPPAALASVPDPEQDDDLSANDNGLGRNQRSRVRELVLLEVLGRDAKAFSLQQLMNALAQRGFNDTPSAVVSQLHRLKKLELIRQPAGSTGMYEITTEGLGHGRNLRSSFGAYLPPG
jgi:hypothetical protein